MIRGFKEVVEEHKHHKGETTKPTRGTRKSAGNDFYLKANYVIPPQQDCAIYTDIKAYMKDDEVLKLYVRSSIGDRGLMLKNGTGIIDSDYYSNPKNDGNIIFKVFNYSNETIRLSAGDRIGQGVFSKYLVTDDDAPLNEKRLGGFGSTND